MLSKCMFHWETGKTRWICPKTFILCIICLYVFEFKKYTIFYRICFIENIGVFLRIGSSSYRLVECDHSFRFLLFVPLHHVSFIWPCLFVPKSIHPVSFSSLTLWRWERRWWWEGRTWGWFCMLSDIMRNVVFNVRKMVRRDNVSHKVSVGRNNRESQLCFRQYSKYIGY